MKVTVKKPCIKGKIIIADEKGGYRSQPYDIPYQGETRFTQAQAKKCVEEWAKTLFGENFRFIEFLETDVITTHLELNYNDMTFKEI